jgi:hypothetical protein
MLLTNASPRGAEFARQAYFCTFGTRRGKTRKLFTEAFMSRSHLPGALLWRNRLAIEEL